MNKAIRNSTIIAGAALLFSAVLFNHRHFLSYAFQPAVFLKINLLLLLRAFVLAPLAAAAFALSFYGWGRRLLSLLGGDNIDKRYTALFSCAIGLGLFNGLVFFLSLPRLLYPFTVVLLIIAGILLVPGKDGTIPKLPSRQWNPLLIPAGIGTAFVLAEALAPPTSWDALAYQIALPKLYAGHHGLFLVPSMLRQQTTIGMEMLSSAGLSLGIETLPAILSFFTLLLVLCAILVFGRKWISGTGALIGFSLFAAMPLTLSIGGAVNNDFSVCLFSLLAFICFFEYRNDKRDFWLFLLSTFSGFAVVAKMTGFITVSWLLLCLLYISWRDNKPLAVKTAVAMAALFLASGSAGYIRNYVWTGNPLFPYLTGLLGGNDPNALDIIMKCNVQIKMTEGVPATFGNFVRLPWFLITSPERFQHQPHYLVISLLGLLAIRMSRFKQRISFREAAILSFALYFSVIWFFSGSQLWRFALIVLPLILLLAGGWWEGITSRPVKIVAACFLALNFIPLLRWNVNNTLFGVFALPSLSQPSVPPRDNYLSRTLNFYDVYDYCNKNLPPDSKILLFREVRGYHLDRPYVWGDPINQSAIDYARFTDAGTLYRHLVSQKITHVVVNTLCYPPSPYYYDEHTIKLMDALLANYGRVIYARNGVFLYQLAGSASE